MSAGAASPTPGRPLSFGTQGLLLLAAIVVLYLPWLGAAPLFDVDEGAFSEATRFMVASGDWMFTYLNGQPRFDKPILVYWLQATSVTLFGVNEFAFRLPSALAAIVWCLVVARFAARHAPADVRPDSQVGALAGWVAATALGVMVIGRAATADALLNMLFALALADAWRWLDSQQRPEDQHDRNALRRLYLWIGLGVLCKGPIGVLVPVAAAFLYSAVSRQWPAFWRAAFYWPGWLIFIAVVLPWYAYAFAIHGRAFWEGFFLKHNVQRFGGTLEGHGGSLVYYVVVLPLLLLPWTGVFVGALRRIRLDWATPVCRFLWVWSLFVIGFFSLSGTKLPHYVLYGSTPLFILCAWHAARINSRWVLLAPALMLGLIVAAPLLVDAVVERMTDPRAGFHVAQLSAAAESAGLRYFGVTIALTLGWLVYLALRRDAPVARQLAVGAAAVALSVTAAVSPWAGDLLAGPVKRAALLAKSRPETAVQWNFHVPSFSVYRQQPTVARPPKAGELAITRIDRLPPGLQADELFRERGVLLLKLREDAPVPPPR